MERRTVDIVLAIDTEGTTNPDEALEKDVMRHYTDDIEAKILIRRAQKLGLIKKVKVKNQWVLRVVGDERKVQSHNKLVRDKIPKIIAKKGGKAVTRTLSKSEYFEALKKKLIEEAREFASKPTKEELADILEVVSALREYLGLTPEELEFTKKKKRIMRGGFKKRIFLLDTMN